MEMLSGYVVVNVLLLCAWAAVVLVASAANLRRTRRTKSTEEEEMAAVKPEMYRQGDVLLVKLEPHLVPFGLVPLDVGQKVILAYGEHTGHAHVLDGAKVKAVLRSDHPITTWDAAAERFIQVLEGTHLRHLDLPRGEAPTGEHADIALSPGVYRVIRQREWTDDDEQRWVND
jgi:hypothetical protein